MRPTARQTRENRTITVDFRSETTYFQRLGDGKAFLECVLVFVMALGFQLKHKATCRGGRYLTRHSHYVRVRLGGVTIWRIQCTTCKAVFTVLPHFALRSRQMHPAVARNALLATHGGLSLEWYAVIYAISPLALYRLICAFGRQSLVTVLTRCGLPLPMYFLADEKHSRCLTEQVYLPTIVCGRVLWHLGYIVEASAAAFTQSYGEFQHAASQQEPLYRVKGVLTDGFDSTTKSMRTLFPGVRLGNCLRHALIKLPSKLVAIASPVRKTLRAQFHTLWYRARQRRGLRVFALGQRLRRFAAHVTSAAGTANGARVRRWFQEKKAGWYAVLEDPQMPATSTLLDQAHITIERKLFAMKGFVRSVGSKRVLALREAARRQSCTSVPHEGARPSLSVQECQHIPQACDGSSTVCRGDQRRPLAASRRVSRLAGIYGQRKRRGDEPSCSSPSVRGGVAGAKTAQDRAPAAASTARPALPNTPAGAPRPTETNHATWERSHPHQPSVRRVLSRRRGQPPAGGEKAARRSQDQESRPGYGDVGPVCCKGKRCGRGNAPTHRASP